jgi:serine/threonine-protein kinase
VNDPLAGTPYRTVRPLGAGGMGEVIEAEHVASGRRVVVKILHGHLSGRADLADRMRLEGEALGLVDHPNVVAVVDTGATTDERPYLVMERLEGRTLRDELAARGPLPAAEAIDLAAQALDGLAAVHDKGLVHRDVKLDNLFVCDAPPGGRRVLKLIDLGVAKVLAAAGEKPAPLLVPTAEGVSMGTPRFFSPEQATGAPLDARADVYAMGLVLYALVTGKTPFDHVRETEALLRAHAAEPPEPPSRRAPRPLPPGLEAAILKALAKAPDERFPSAAAFAAEIRRIASAAPPQERPLRLLTLFLIVMGATLLLSAAVTAIVLIVTG